MSRIGEDESTEDERRNWRLLRSTQIRSRRGQAFLRELLAALEALPQKRLITDAIAKGNEVCALGALAVHRGMKHEALATIVVDYDDDEWDGIEMGEWAQDVLQAPSTLAYHIPWLNDEGCVGASGKPWEPTPEERYAQVVAWVRSQIKGDS